MIWHQKLGFCWPPFYCYPNKCPAATFILLQLQQCNKISDSDCCLHNDIWLGQYYSIFFLDQLKYKPIKQEHLLLFWSFEWPITFYVWQDISSSIVISGKPVLGQLVDDYLLDFDIFHVSAVNELLHYVDPKYLAEELGGTAAQDVDQWLLVQVSWIGNGTTLFMSIDGWTNFRKMLIASLWVLQSVRGEWQHLLKFWIKKTSAPWTIETTSERWDGTTLTSLLVMQWMVIFTTC